MLHLVHDGLHRISDTRQDDDSTGSTVPIGAEITGQFLVDLVANPIRDKGETFHKILEVWLNYLLFQFQVVSCLHSKLIKLQSHQIVVYTNVSYFCNKNKS